MLLSIFDQRDGLRFYFYIYVFYSNYSMTVILSAKTYSSRKCTSNGPVLILVQVALFILMGLIKHLVFNLCL